jgi:hypothetical protein
MDQKKKVKGRTAFSERLSMGDRLCGGGSAAVAFGKIKRGEKYTAAIHHHHHTTNSSVLFI